jgi:hypothetical protein
MSVFYEEVRRGKELAKGSRHRKNGSKSRKCSLPSDRLTEKQRKKLNGDIMSYQLKQPKTWEQFKAMPVDIQQEFVMCLQSEFNIGTAQFAAMFGIAKNTFWLHCNKHDLRLKRSGYRMMSIANSMAWGAFLKSGSQAPISDAPDVPTTSTPTQEVSGDTGRSTGSKGMEMSQLHIQFNGVTNPMDLVTILTTLVGGRTGTVTVSFKAE